MPEDSPYFGDDAIGCSSGPDGPGSPLGSQEGSDLDNDATRALRRSPLFADLDATKIQQLALRFQKKNFRKGDTVCREGDPAETFLLVASGDLAVFKTIASEEREQRRLGPGDSFGEMALVSDEKRFSTLKALTDCECLELNRDGFKEVMESSPLFAQHALSRLIERLQFTSFADQAMIYSLANLAESRDPEIEVHLRRVQEYCAALASKLAERPEYSEVITPVFIDNLCAVAPLHDIGKAAIPGEILMKSGKLSAEEFHLMKDHARLGAEMLDAAPQLSDHEMFRMAHNIILYHHENYDGQGYPEGLCGDEIPLEARIMAAADVYDALVSRRVYKPPYGRDETYFAIQRMSGKKFDPIIAETALACMTAFETSYLRYGC